MPRSFGGGGKSSSASSGSNKLQPVTMPNIVKKFAEGWHLVLKVFKEGFKDKMSVGNLSRKKQLLQVLPVLTITKIIKRIRTLESAEERMRSTRSALARMKIIDFVYSISTIVPNLSRLS